MNADDVVIDVSSHQSDIDWQMVSADVDAAYIRATMGAIGRDEKWVENAFGCVANDVQVGFYHLFRADGDPVIQARNFHDAIRSFSGALTPAVDVEEALNDDTLPQVQYANRLKRFITEFEALTGSKPMIYTSASQWSKLTGNALDDVFSECPLWVAHYDAAKPALPPAWKQWVLWQYTSDGAVDGIGGRVDMNRVMPSLPFALDPPLKDFEIIQPFGVNWTGTADFYTKYNLPAHEGIDCKAPAGTPVFACAGGVVTRIERKEFTGSGSPYGIQVRIEHQWGETVYETIYAHLQSVVPELAVGKRVKRGQQIGLSNNTGNSRGDHLHLSLKKRGATARGDRQRLGDGTYAVYPSDLVDPTPYF